MAWEDPEGALKKGPKLRASKFVCSLRLCVCVCGISVLKKIGLIKAKAGGVQLVVQRRGLHSCLIWELLTPAYLRLQES